MATEQQLPEPHAATGTDKKMQWKREQLKNQLKQEAPAKRRRLSLRSSCQPWPRPSTRHLRIGALMTFFKTVAYLADDVDAALTDQLIAE